MRYTAFTLLSLIFTACTGNYQTNPELQSVNSWAITGFEKADSINPVLRPSENQSFKCPVSGEQVKWEARNVLNPAAIVKDGKVWLIYRAQDNAMTSRLGLAVSGDGLHFTKEPEPVFYPDNDSMRIFEWKGGVEDPRIIESEDGSFIMTYTAYDGKTARLCLATSKDLHNWTKHGLVLKDLKYRNLWSKSGAIVAKVVNGRVVATKIAGKFWMYFGDTSLFMAASDDLINWTAVEDPESGKMISVLHPRPGYFDSRLVEPGPYALLSDNGILLIYNSSNASGNNDTSLPAFTYSAGQALFDSNYPYKLIGRTDSYFMKPDKPYEITGEVNNVCFIEGMVQFNNKWLIYYGTADSKIAVAAREQ
jgi:predicted GH43/DUF377 family glycosyl hydrolase